MCRILNCSTAIQAYMKAAALAIPLTFSFQATQGGCKNIQKPLDFWHPYQGIEMRATLSE
jgi:hypothetical protein